MKPHILLIEDNRPNRELARYLLEAHGFECEEAIDGESGLEQARDRKPDLVICDLRLPGIDGFEVLRGVRAEPSLVGIPVVAVTAYAMVGDRERVLGAGFDGYISKPLDPQTFVQQIAGYLGLDQQQGAAPPVAPVHRGARILVVDDRLPNRELIATLLGYYGHTVLQASDGAAALEQLRIQPVDLVITDLLMPNMDGEELCRRLRAQAATASLPIIIHTASYRARQGRQIADRVGVQWVLPKPSEPADIVAMVSQALGAAAVWPVAPALAVRHPVTPGAEVDEAYLGLAALQVRNERLTVLLENAVQIAEAQGRTLAAGGLGPEAQSLSQRLGALVNLGLQVSFERDPDALADLVSGAAQDIMSARYIGIALVSPDGRLRKFASRGLESEAHTAIALSIADCAAARRLLGPGGEGRMLVAGKTEDFMGLPAEHPPVQNMIACRVAGRELACGWLYAADRLGDEGFTADDERLLLALGSQLAGAWQALGVLDDLDRRVAERTRELQEVNAELEAFSILVSHDLRAPLGIIDGYARALGERFSGALPMDALRYIDKVGHNVQVMTTLIDDLLHFARTSRMGIVMGTVNLSGLVQQCLDKFEDEITKRSVVVQLGALPSCRADSALLAQVMINLIGNALKYSRDQARPVIEIQALRLESELVVSVRDNGAGFPMEHVQKLFSPFQRLHSVTEFAGSGVGLALVKQVIGRHGGRVWAEGQVGQGACFSFSLPVQRQQ